MNELKSTIGNMIQQILNLLLYHFNDELTFSNDFQSVNLNDIFICSLDRFLKMHKNNVLNITT